MIQTVEAPVPGVVHIVSPVPVVFSFDLNEVGASLDQSSLEANVTANAGYGKVVVRASSVDFPTRYGKVEINFLIPLTVTVL